MRRRQWSRDGCGKDERSGACTDHRVRSPALLIWIGERTVTAGTQSQRLPLNAVAVLHNVKGNVAAASDMVGLLSCRFDQKTSYDIRLTGSCGLGLFVSFVLAITASGVVSRTVLRFGCDVVRSLRLLMPTSIIARPAVRRCRELF